MWETLEVAYEGTTSVKENCLSILIGEYKLFKMDKGIIKDMQIKYMHNVNQLSALGKTYSLQEQVRKILKALPLEWQPKVTSTGEVRGESMWLIAALFKNLAEYKGKITALKEATDKKKGITLRAGADDDDKGEEDKEDLDNEELGMLIKKFGKFFKKKKNFKEFPRRVGTSSKKESKELPTCFECKKVGHMKWECSQWQKK